MDFQYSEDQQMLADTLKRFIDKDYAFESRRAVIASEPGFSRAHWQAFAELGLLGLTLPSEFGGFDGTSADTFVVMREFGRGLVLEPYLSTVVLCGGLLERAASAQQKEALLPAIAGGELIMALAATEPGGRYDLSHVTTTAQGDGDGFMLTGEKAVVLHGGAADKWIVSARTAGDVRDPKGITLFLVDRNIAGVSVRDYRTLDNLRAAEIRFDRVRLTEDAVIGEAGEGLPALEYAVDLGIAALCAEAAGIMEALNAATLEYLKTRKQFGVPIGTFQALQHRLVDMLIDTEQAKSMAYLAAAKARSPNRMERRRALSAAKLLVGKAGRFVSQQAVQLHGGMGVTDELIVSHYFRRLTMIEATFGDVDHHTRQFGEAMAA